MSLEVDVLEFLSDHDNRNQNQVTIDDGLDNIVPYNILILGRL